MRYVLFKASHNLKDKDDLDKKYNISVLKPSIQNMYFEGEKKNFRVLFFRLYITILTLGKVRIYGIKNTLGKVICSTYVIPSNWKYPFLGKYEVVIGPSETVEECRGQGLHTWLVNYLVKNNPNLVFYAFIRADNISSIKSFEKAKFIRTGDYIEGVGRLNRFIRIKSE